MNKFLDLLSLWSSITDALEKTVVDLIAATVPWIAPIIPAWLVSVGVYKTVERNIIFAGLAGLVVEILGISTITTTILFWTHNQDVAYSDGYKVAVREERGRSSVIKKEWRAPTWLAGMAALYYMVIVIIASVILDGGPDRMVMTIKALLSSTSVVGAVILGVRSQYKLRTTKVVKMEKVVKDEKLQLSQRKLQMENMHSREKSGADWRGLELAEKKLIAEMTVEELMQRYGISKRTAYNWQKSAKNLTLG